MKRILDCRASDFRQMGREELKGAILAAEGRTLIAETVVVSQPLLSEITNDELANPVAELDYGVTGRRPWTQTHLYPHGCSPGEVKKS